MKRCYRFGIQYVDYGTRVAIKGLGFGVIIKLPFCLWQGNIKKYFSKEYQPNV